MANVRELLARLNPATVKFDVGRGGGAPELTAQDVAAALAFVQPGLGRELLIACWWPDAAGRRSDRLRDAIYANVHPELARQTREISEARTHLGMLHACAGWVQTPNADLRRELRAAQAHLEAVRLRCWPTRAWEMLPTIAHAVVMEIAHRHLCPDCSGRESVVLDDLLIDCPTCHGTGVIPISDRKRADAIGRDESTYRGTWRAMYEWVLKELQDAEREAARALTKALRTG